MEASPTSLRLGVGLRALAIVDVRLVGTLWLNVALGLEAPLNRSRYVVDDGAQKVVVLDPWPIQPLVMVGFKIELLR